MDDSLPSVSVILAVLNEREFIDLVLSELLDQDYEGPFEVIVADGGSSDGTRERLEHWARQRASLTVIDNRRRRQSPGLNAAAMQATGEILIRADGHTSYAADYVRRSVEALCETGGAVGGRMNPAGGSSFGRGVAAAMNSPLTMGPARFHHASGREEVDTVYLGAFKAEDFIELEGFRSFPSGSSEDADFYYRWRMSGRSVHVDPRIRTTYTPREDPASLWRQYWRYGQGKAEMWWANGRLPSWRPLAPLALSLSLIAAAFSGGISGVWWPLVALTVVWVMLLIWVGLRSSAGTASTFSAAAIMHLAYGLGMLSGLFFGYHSTKDLRTSVPEKASPRSVPGGELDSDRP